MNQSCHYIERNVGAKPVVGLCGPILNSEVFQVLSQKYAHKGPYTNWSNLQQSPQTIFTSVVIQWAYVLGLSVGQTGTLLYYRRYFSLLDCKQGSACTHSYSNHDSSAGRVRLQAIYIYQECFTDHKLSFQLTTSSLIHFKYHKWVSSTAFAAKNSKYWPQEESVAPRSSS